MAEASVLQTYVFLLCLQDEANKLWMKMLFTWSTRNMCIIFPEWRVQGTGSLIASLFAIILLCAGYEAVRSFTRLYEATHTQRLKAFSSSVLAGKFFIISDPFPSHPSLPPSFPASIC